MRGTRITDDPIQDPDVLGEAATGGLEAGGHPDFLVNRALRKDLPVAEIAVAARNVMEDHHPVSRLERPDALPNRGDRAGSLMPEDARD